MAGKQTHKPGPVQPIKETVVKEKEKSHTRPTYREMTQDALANLNNPKGVSSEEMLQYLVAKYNLVEKTAKRYLSVVLSNGVKRGIYLKIRQSCSTDVYSLQEKDSTRQKPETKKTAARPGVKEQFQNQDTVTTSQHLPKRKPPKFSEMVQAALTDLKQGNGSSRENILKYVLSKYSINENTSKRSLGKALKTGIKNGMFVKTISSAGTKTYKLSNKRHEAKQHKTQEKPSKRRKGKRFSPSAGKQLSASISGNSSSHKGSRKLKSPKHATTDGTYATAESQTYTETRTTDMQQEHGERSSEYILSDVTISRRETIFVKIPNDDQDCQIDGLDITPDGRIVLVDGVNKRLKIFDQKGLCISFYTFHELEIGPTALSVLNNKEVIVSLHRHPSVETYLHIMDIEGNKLTIKQTIPIFGYRINGIATYQGKIFLSGELLGSNEIRFVRLIDRDGQTIWNTNLKRKSLHEYHIERPSTMVFPPMEYFLPDCLSCFLSYYNRPQLIVTDAANKRLLVLDGETGATIKECGFDIDHIKGTTVGKDIIYASFFTRQEIAAFDVNLSSNKTLIRLSWRPVRIKYDDLYNQLLVSKTGSREANNCIECFKVDP